MLFMMYVILTLKTIKTITTIMSSPGSLLQLALRFVLLFLVPGRRDHGNETSLHEDNSKISCAVSSHYSIRKIYTNVINTDIE